MAITTSSLEVGLGPKTFKMKPTFLIPRIMRPTTRGLAVEENKE